MPIDSVDLQEGVSEALARNRKQVLSNITYKLSFDIPAQKDSPIPATERITFDWQKNTNSLSIDFKEKEDHLQKIRVNGKDVPLVFEKEHVQIAAEYLKKGKNTVDIDFIAGDLSLNRNAEYLYTLLVPDRARTVFPCLDQPDLKASFELSLTVPADWISVSNAPLRDSVISRMQKSYHFHPSDLLPTYLFSFVAGKFDRVARTPGGREMTLYHRETDTSKIRLSLDPIFETHADALGFMEDYTQIKYPFQKFDFAAIPDFQYGGMEHAGAIQYKAASLFLDKGATRNQKMSRIKLLAHETAHMWFGDLVTMRWFNDVWMKEVFANFMADKIAKVAQPLSNYDLEFLISHFPTAYGVDRTEGPNAIGQPLDNLNQAGTMYGPIIYHKAPIMMRQLERLMGPDALRDGLREYLKKYAYGNATWPDLIAILDKYTPIDLAAWNKVWVNETGRPRFDYNLNASAGKITNLTITQQSEDEFDRTWPQYFEIALIYRDRVEELTVNMNADTVLVPEVVGRDMPLDILMNSSGQGYGLFPMSRNMVVQLPAIASPLMRASAYISLYENMLNKNPAIPPTLLADLYVKMLDKETEELSLDLITDQLSHIFWQFMKPEARKAWADYLEKKVWEALSRIEDGNKKKIVFKLYQNIAESQEAKDRLYEIWRTQQAPAGVTLTEDDYTSLALALAVREYGTSDISAKNILEQQLTRVKNPDRKKRLEFMLPALSADVSERDAFFNSLKEEKNREHESWVTAALGYLHHPLRIEASQKYLRPSLDLLEEIQKTGDIFFPEAWLRATLGSYQSTEAERIVRSFLQEHPNYNPRLKAKLLQSADNLFRAERIVN
ncbi:M1 family aminopeptidase [Persicitalea jodogahamensis]|uniref:Aminopeptidase N n=1 Tax=Persicitalea jodogahamensis TaxID=402147 RepID=A0A8J3G7G7_9BACT|nr:M1 family aminopeptidase [Persicitalea jodogahamensis]GHB55139.1 aminopeptidase N [Persicitalea jodogahamensis]